MFLSFNTWLKMEFDKMRMKSNQKSNGLWVSGLRSWSYNFSCFVKYLWHVPPRLDGYWSRSQASKQQPATESEVYSSVLLIVHFFLTFSKTSEFKFDIFLYMPEKCHVLTPKNLFISAEIISQRHNSRSFFISGVWFILTYQSRFFLFKCSQHKMCSRVRKAH